MAGPSLIDMDEEEQVGNFPAFPNDSASATPELEMALSFDLALDLDLALKIDLALKFDLMLECDFALTFDFMLEFDFSLFSSVS